MWNDLNLNLCLVVYFDIFKSCAKNKSLYKILMLSYNYVYIGKKFKYTILVVMLILIK